MGDIYVRILARLEAPLLQRHCSLVFNDELDAIRVEIKEIMAAYERLQEVREAVASLENGRTDVSRSASLMEIVDSTAQLQDELAQRVKVIETALLSRPVVKLDEEKPKAEAIADDATMEKSTPAKHKPSKEDKPKRKRRESVSETAQRVVDRHEGSDQETNQETPVSPVKKKKTKKATKKTIEHESAALEATASHKSLLSSSWSSTASTGEASGSETESEGEDQMTASMEMDDDRTPKTNGELSYDQWAEMVHEASGRAQRTASGKKERSLHDVTPLVESLCELLATARVPPGSSYSRLVEGQFNNLIVLTIRTLDRVVHDPLVASLASTILRSMESAIARESALEAMRKHTGDLDRIREKMLKAPPAPAPKQPPVSSTEAQTSSKDAPFNWGQWRDRVRANVHAASLIATDGQQLSMNEVAPFVDDFQATLRIISTTKRTDMNADTMIEFFRMVSCAARVFESPGVTKPFLPLLNKVMFAIDDVVLLRGKFSNLRGHSQDLLAIRRRATQAHEDAEREREREHQHAEAERAAPSKPKSGGAVSNDKESMRFEALVSIADELMALPLSERRGRVSNYAFALQKELKLVFPTKGQRSTPSRTAYEAIVDAVKKAIELVQDEPHNEQNDTFFKQFLELLFTIGGRYNMFKQVVARSRDDLYLYLYPDATTPMNPSGGSSSKSKSTDTATSTNSKHSEEVSLREQLQSAYKKADSWDHDVFSLKEFDDVMRVLRGVMGADSKSWRVRRDRTVADCLALMAQRALAIKKKEHRDGRLASLAQWQKQMERR